MSLFAANKTTLFYNTNAWENELPEKAKKHPFSDACGKRHFNRLI